MENYRIEINNSILYELDKMERFEWGDYSIAMQQFSRFIRRVVWTEDYPWLFGEHIDYNQQERLLYYKPNQLIGIIFGALMNEQQKARLQIIIQERMDRISRVASSDNLAVFDFVVFQAKLSENSRNVNIDAEELYKLNIKYDKNHKDFNRFYDAWKEGWAIEFHGSGGSCKRFE